MAGIGQAPGGRGGDAGTMTTGGGKMMQIAPTAQRQIESGPELR